MVVTSIKPVDEERDGEKVAFFSHPDLRIGSRKYDFKQLKSQYKYLDVLPDITVSFNEVKVLLGQDVYHLIRPIE